MTMEFKVQGEIQITMYDYTKKLIDSLPDYMKEIKYTSAPEYLFQTDGEEVTAKLLTERSDISARFQYKYSG